METTTDLANSIGLGTRQDAAFKGMPLTNFANKEYQINANNAKLEAERKRKEAELEKQLMSKINVTGKFDKIAAPQIQKAYANMVMNKGYSNPEARYQFDVMKQNHELASAARKEQSDLLNKSDLLIDPKIKAALISHDTPQLELLSKDPNSGIVKDEQLPDTYTLAPEARIPRVPNITMEVKKYIPTDEANLDRSQTKLIKTVGGKNIYGTPIKESVLNQAATEVLSNPVLAKNWLAVHQDEIGKEVSKGVPLQQALINSFKDKNRFIETDTYTPSKSGGSGSSTTYGANGLIESHGIRMKPDQSRKGFININKIVKEGKDPEILSATILDKNGKPHNFAKIEGFYKLGNDNYRVVGSVKNEGNTDEVSAYNVSGEQLAKSVGMSATALENIKMYFDAEKEEQKRQRYLKWYNLNKSTKTDYKDLFNGDKEGKPTYTVENIDAETEKIKGSQVSKPSGAAKVSKWDKNKRQTN